MNIPFAWDACGLINLVASGQAESILISLDAPHYVVTYVRLHEVQSIRPLPEEADQSLRKIDFTPILAKGLLHDVELTQDEEVTRVSFAITLDDGEAMTAAVAKQRGYRVVTDDRAAIRLLQSQAIPYLRTTEWLKHWADKTGAEKESLALAVRRIKLCARFRPRDDDPHFDWWHDALT